MLILQTYTDLLTWTNTFTQHNSQNLISKLIKNAKLHIQYLGRGLHNQIPWIIWFLQIFHTTILYEKYL